MPGTNEAAADQSDVLLFAEETADQPSDLDRGSWKLMTVDDEEEVHTITKMVLEGFTFEGRGLTFLSAYSGEEARRLVLDHPDTAVILLDVVMETDHSGLDVVRFIREELKNRFVRIILRTGRPGQVPERKVITEYDINDYKEKTELTSQKLFTTVTAALRSYRDLKIIDKNRRGLEQIIESSAHLFEMQSLRKFAKGILTQLLSILHLDENSLYVQRDGFTASKEKDDFIILAATGVFEQAIGKPLKHSVPEEVMELLIEALDQKTSLFMGDNFVGYFSTASGAVNLLYLSGCKDLGELDRHLIQVFSANVAIAFENIFLNREILETQKEVILTLGEVVENRSKETANHVRRVAEFCYLLALKAGLGEETAELLRFAAPMHDVGKVGVPDRILFKPGRLTPDEFEKIKPHATIGYEIFKRSSRKIMKAAAIVAQQHHERWDGTGYPQGLRGEKIHIFGRIAGIADVFDALSHKRVYKHAWEMEEVIETIWSERGKQFDPRLVDIFLESIHEFIAINNSYPDE